MKQFIGGFCLGMIGVTLMSAFNDVAVNLAELAKAKIAVEISACNDKIGGTTHVRAIGFATTDEEEDDYDE